MTWIKLANCAVREDDITQIIQLPDSLVFKYVVCLKNSDPMTIQSGHEGYDAIRYLFYLAGKKTREYSADFHDILTAE